jgi:hypothetical protein
MDDREDSTGFRFGPPTFPLSHPPFAHLARDFPPIGIESTIAPARTSMMTNFPLLGCVGVAPDAASRPCPNRARV